jgi:hypothetical protein
LAGLTVTSLVVGVPVAYFASTSNLGGTNVDLFVVRYVICCTTVFAVTLSAASLWLAEPVLATHYIEGTSLEHYSRLKAAGSPWAGLGR